MVLFRVDVEQNISDFVAKNLTNTPEYEIVRKNHSWTLLIYSIMVGVATLFTLGRAFAYFLFSSRASVRLHKIIFEKIINAKMLFFDTHFVGNILNRFSRDLALIDEVIPYIVFDAIRVSLEKLPQNKYF